jgi:hypothetical protein
MMQFRTTVSAVFWTETPDESDALVAGLTALLPSADQASTLSTVEYISGGRPADPTVPTIEPVEPVPEEVNS